MTMFNEAVAKAAHQVAQAAQKDFFNTVGKGAVTLSAVAGAGKSHFVTDTVKKCRPRGIRVAVAAPTNEQVFSLVHSIAASDPTQPVAYVPAQDIDLQCGVRARDEVEVTFPRSGLLLFTCKYTATSGMRGALVVED